MTLLKVFYRPLRAAEYVRRWSCRMLAPHAVAVEKLVTVTTAMRKVPAAAMTTWELVERRGRVGGCCVYRVLLVVCKVNARVNAHPVVHLPKAVLSAVMCD